MGYAAWGVLGQGILVPILYTVLDKEKERDHILFAVLYGGGSLIGALSLSIAQWLVNGSHYRGRSEPVRLEPFKLQFAAKF